MHIRIISHCSIWGWSNKICNEVKYINIKNEEIAIFIISTVYFSVVYKVENNDEHANQSYTVAENTTPK